MFRNRIWEAIDGGNMQLYVEMDPSQRYGRFKDVLGKGAVKTVYRAYDEFLGMEVAWNLVELNDFLRSPEELQRLYSEVHLLKNLNYDSIMRFYASWVDVDRRTFNFITELFTSGSLREYRRRYKKVNIRAIKNWARQILKGLNYLHTHDPPVIHRDLKCDNIFVNGHLGQVKIGDMGLAAMLDESRHAHSVIGTPEFMAPELYEEHYDELVDIYSFGMCVLEMITSEYPYSECSNPAQIYKKVTTGKLPVAFYRIDDVEARRFIGRCLEKASCRPSSQQLLLDPFLSIEEVEELCSTKISSQQWIYHELPPPIRPHAKSTDMTIRGTLNPEDGTIFLKVQISDIDSAGSKGRGRNIYFPFDITSDTCMNVATEMVKELEITDWEPLEIAKMIEEEISNLVPSWKYQIDPLVQGGKDDNDDNNLHPPFYYSSSFSSSSQASLPGPLSAQFYQYDWLTEVYNADDDTSSQCSSSNLKYSTTASEDDLMTSSGDKKETGGISMTRFGPKGSMAKVNCIRASKGKEKMVRTGSLVDLCSQLLHQRLENEINNRRLFKTVGSVEHIGYQQPDFVCDKIHQGKREQKGLV